VSEPIDLMTAAQDAVVALLQQQLPPAQRGLVRHTLKQNAQPPFHLIGDIASANEGTKGDQLEEIEVDVHTVYRGTDRRDLLAMLHQVRLATDDRSIEVGGASFRFAWLGAVADGFAADGVTCAGLTTLHLSAEPA
jgi:hypothetical protein